MSNKGTPRGSHKGHSNKIWTSREIELASNRWLHLASGNFLTPASKLGMSHQRWLFPVPEFFFVSLGSVGLSIQPTKGFDLQIRKQAAQATKPAFETERRQPTIPKSELSGLSVDLPQKRVPSKAFEKPDLPAVFFFFFGGGVGGE